MSEYDVFLEVDASGRCMAHVPAFPGCVVRESSREAALLALPNAVESYLGWLQRHGEQVDHVSRPISFRVAGLNADTGPFDPGDQAALFPWETGALTLEEMARTSQLAAYNRADLLALVRPLSRSVRKWKPGPDEMSIDQVLRHIGNSEQWYVSRLVPPDTLPAQWSDDEALPTLTFLKMTRETVERRLRQLSDEELGQVFTPTHFTEKEGEPWTARKVMRRWLEHEREHTAHIAHIVRRWRLHLLARLTADRAAFFWQMRGLDHDTLCHTPVSDIWTAKDLLVHVGLWDALHTERIALILDGRVAAIKPVHRAGMDERNAEQHLRYRNIPLEQALALCLKERSGYMAMLARVPDERLHRQIRMPWGSRTRMRIWAKWRHVHDAAHTRDLQLWRRSLRTDERSAVGPKSVLRAILRAARKEILSLVALVPERDRDKKPLTGVWTLKDVLGHLTDWEQVGVVGLRQFLAGQPITFEPLVGDIQRFNEVSAAARRDQPWNVVWSAFETTRKELSQLVERVSQDQLAASISVPWGSDITIYQWVLIWPEHDREHAADLRQALESSGTART